jgi:hypothetical protein
MEQQDGFVPSTPWDRCSDLVWTPRKQRRGFWPSFAPTRARDGGGRPKMVARPSTTSEANVAVALPHDVELQIQDEAD